MSVFNIISSSTNPPTTLVSYGDCVAQSAIPQFVTICYGSFYGVSLLIISILAHFEVKQHENYHRLSCFIKATIWYRTVWNKRRIYLALLSHVWDQATDVGVILEFYYLWQAQKADPSICTHLTLSWFFLSSVFVLVLYRTVSAVIIGLNTTWIQGISQFFDLELFHTIVINYKLKTDKPCNPQRWINSMEASFESGPQTLIQFIYLTTSGQFSNFLIVTSFVFSFISIVGRTVSDDAHG